MVQAPALVIPGDDASDKRTMWLDMIHVNGNEFGGRTAAKAQAMATIPKIIVQVPKPL